MKSIFVTGGIGFIGSHTCTLLLKYGYKIYILDSLKNSSIETLKKVKGIAKKEISYSESQISFFRGDIRNFYDIDKVFKIANAERTPIKSVIHFAGLKSVKDSVYNPLDYWDVNVNGTIQLLTAMEKNNCFNIIFSSSATVYGNAEKVPIKENSKIIPNNPYGFTKVAAENILENIFISNPKKWSIAILRYFNPIGAHPSGLIGENLTDDISNIFPLICKVACGKIERLPIYGNNWSTKDGTGIRDYIHVMDLAEGHINAMEYLINNKPQKLIFNLGTGIGTSVLELIETFESVNDLKINFFYTDKREGDSAISVACNKLATNTLGWFPKRNIREMCKDGWEWTKDKYK